DDSLPMNACTGQLIKWETGSVWDTYAYPHHDDNAIGWTPIGYEGPNYIRLQSKGCAIFLESQTELNRRSCNDCFGLLNSRQLMDFIERSKKDMVPHAPWKYLNARQLKNMVITARKKSNTLKLKALNASRKNGRLQKKLSDYQRLVMLISQHKIAGVSRILSVALRNGANIESVCVKLHRAITGVYSPKSGWTSRELDVAFLIKAIGGPRLLYALQKAEGYPSLSTLRRRRPIRTLRVSVGIPDQLEINENITSLFGDGGRVPPTVPEVGQVVMIDGAAIEEAIRYDFQENKLLGLCREHSEDIKTEVNTVEDIHNVADALFGPERTCHRGKDATVLGLAPVTATENYHVTPLILSPSCKAETGADLASWVGDFIDHYHDHPDGAMRHGKITTLATDGESSFRKLRFLLCLTETVDINSELGKRLSGLPGLNLSTGYRGILGTCDPKHVVKRFATMLRSTRGFVIGQRKNDADDVLHALKLVPMSHASAILLLNPTDKQNVPKAVWLIEELFKLYGRDLTQLGLLPSNQDRVKSIAFVAKVFSFFLFPFIKVEWTLSQQIRSLSTYAHLITALYLQHQLAFMSSALFADSQAIVKHIIFTVARLQLSLPADFPYFILLEGTDRLENIFSHVRTQDHARNFDVQQLSHKLSIAAEIDAVFQRQPDLDRGHVRRNLINARGVDHMNPKSWVGDVCIGNVDIQQEYLLGRQVATDLLQSHFPERRTVNFDRLFSKAGVDHLRPLTNKGYVGSLDSEVIANEDELPLTGRFLDVNGHTESERLASDLGQMDDDFEDARDAIDIEDYTGLDVAPEDLANPPDPPTDSEASDNLTSSSGPPTKKSDAHYLTVDNVKHYIPTLISKILGADRDQTKIEQSRLSHVQGITRERALNSSGDQLDATDGKVKAGDLGAILARVGSQICLVVVEALNFKQGTSTISRAMVDSDDLDAEGDKATSVALQFLQLVSNEPNQDADNSDLTCWWPEQYITIQDVDDGPILPRHLVTRVPTRLFHLLSPHIIYNGSNHPTWSIPHVHLEEILQRAWEELEPDSDNLVQNIKSLPEISGQALQKLPYRLLEDKSLALFIDPKHIPSELTREKLDGKERRPCHFCRAECRISDMRVHVGTHILKAQRGVPDETLKIGLNPCGWCGKDGCKTRLPASDSSKSIKISSDCEYHYQNMKYHLALKPTNRSPCTNVPILCPICPRPETFWKYAFIAHVVDRHLTDDGDLPFLPMELWATTHISKWEEAMMGIPDVKTDEWRSFRQVPDSDVVEEI
ncbi:hypothetical protein M413DRAFT_36514, partial [Hebeloma cylindrosporum]